MRVREAIYAHGRVATENIELLLRFAREFRGEVCPEWDLLFNEVLTDYVVRQNEPQNHIPQHKADWLTKKLAANGGLSSQLEFDMLLEVMAKADGMPVSLSVFVLNVVKAAILSGSREAVTGEKAPAGVVTSADADALRAVFYAAAIGTWDHVRREQAEVLFEIAHAATEADPAFDELFARAIGNYLMAIRAAGVDVNAALRFDAWLDNAKSPESFLMGVAGSGAWIGDRDEIHGLLLQPLREALRAGAGGKDDTEAGWVVAHLKRQGALSSAEKRVLKLLGVEASVVALPVPPVQAVMKNQAIVVPRHSEAAVPGRVAAVAPCASQAASVRATHSVVPKRSEPAGPGRVASAVPRHSEAVVPKRAEAAGSGNGEASESKPGEGRSWSLMSIDWGSSP